MSQSGFSIHRGQAVGDYSADLGAFQAAVREFEAFVESERPTLTPASRILVGAFCSLAGIGLGYALLALALHLTR